VFFFGVAIYFVNAAQGGSGIEQEETLGYAFVKGICGV